MNHKNSLGKRVAALLGVAVLLFLVILTLVFAITGNPNFLGMLLITLMAPILLWIYMYIYQLIHGKSAEKMAQEEIEKGQKPLDSQK